MNEYALENYNIATDARSCDEAKQPLLYLDDGSEIELQTTWIVCPVCHGDGSHVNPAIDAGGLSHDMMDDPDFMDGYISGTYDVTCNSCHGKRVVPDVDWSALSDDHRELYEIQLQADAECRAEQLAEIRAGC